MSNALDTASSSQHAILLTLSWHTSTSRYCTWEEDLIIDEQTFTADLNIGVRCDKLHGGTNPETCELTVRRDMEPFATVLTTVPTSSITVLVEEVDPADGGTRRAIFAGDVMGVISSLGGRGDCVGVKVVSLKERLGISLGAVCGSQCAWTLGDVYCKVDLSELTEAGTIATMTGATVTITGLDSHCEKYWHRGYIVKDGIRIMIRSWSSGTTFILMRLPPPGWLAQVVDVHPGCDKDLTTCEDVWDNLDNYGGLGQAMPDHHPQFESSVG